MTSMQYLEVSTKAGYQYDANGRMNGMTWDSGTGPLPYANATHGPAGELLTLAYGAGTETRTYNSLLQMTHQVVPGYLDMTYNYSATQNNVRITGSVDAVTGENTSYSHDALNRLSGAVASGQWSATYGYDGFGNLTSKTGTGGAPTMTASYDGANHQVGAYYDANGNDVRGKAWTVANRLQSQWTSVGYAMAETMYGYDPWGKRVVKAASPDVYGTGGGPTGWTYELSFHGITGQRLVTESCPWPDGQQGPPTCTVTGQNVYFGGRQLVSGGVSVATDRLGSVRANSQGERFSYYPYGEERTSPVDGRDKFGTYFRDGVGQDYADQRYFGSGTGRFWSVDPAGIGVSDPGELTSINLYAYVGGDPVNHLDRHGLCGVLLAGITMQADPSSAFDHELQTLGAVGAFPYAGQDLGSSLLSVVSQATIGPNASTAAALSALQSALGSNNGSIDVIAYSGGAQAFATALGQLSAADQGRIGTIVHLSPGMGGGTLPTPSGASNATVVLGADAFDVAATVGTTIPWGVRIITSSCDHQDIACLLRNAPLAQITANGPCNDPKAFSLQVALGGAGMPSDLPFNPMYWYTMYEAAIWRHHTIEVVTSQIFHWQ